MGNRKAASYSERRRDFVRLGLGVAGGLALPAGFREAFGQDKAPVGTWPAGSQGDSVFIGVLVATGLLIWWLFRRRRRKPAVVVVDPFERAESEFERIEALHLIDAGERGRHVTLMVEVLRDYLAARYAAAALSQTTTELQRSARELSFVPQDRLIRVLTEADLIKFARRPVSGDRAREIGREAHAIVSRDHEASQPSAQETAA